MRLTPIKLRRLEQGLHQLDVARRARITRAHLSEIENGHRLPTGEELRRLATALSVPVESLTPAVAPASA